MTAHLFVVVFILTLKIALYSMKTSFHDDRMIFIPIKSDVNLTWRWLSKHE